MDADGRLTALKRAYAEIILNTAKEAAARIMVSERKVVRFERELNASKEQALQMLLRLKQMMDSKVGGAEMTYLSQQRKIEELEGQLQNAKDTISKSAVTSLSQQRKTEEIEAQLHEAEDIVKDLREELREVQGELERVRNKKSEHTGERDIAPPQEQSSQENGFHDSQPIVFPPAASRLETFSPSEIKNSHLNQGNEVHKWYNANDYNIGNSYICKPDLPSKSEENRLDISHSIISRPQCHLGNSSVSKPDLPSVILRSKEPELYRNRRTQRIRAFEEKLMAGELSFSDTIDDGNYETSGREDGDIEGMYKTPIYKADNVCTTEKKVVVQEDRSWHQVRKMKSSRRKRRRATIYKKSKTPSSRYLSNQVLKRDRTSDISCAEAKSVNNNAQSGGDPSNMPPSLSTDTTDNATLLKCTNKNQAPTDKLLRMTPVSGSAENLDVPICKMDDEKLDVPVVNSETKTSDSMNGIPNQPVTDRVFKYTFQRKRKKESLSSSDGNANAEESILKKKTVEIGPLQMEKSSSTTESSRDSRRVAQVARQLISLSEKKWWQ